MDSRTASDLSRADHAAGRPGTSAPYAAEDEPREVSLLDVLLMVTRHRRAILLTAAALAVLGVVYALLQRDEYTASATLVREAEEGFAASGAISALRSFGFDLGATEPGLSVEAYPDILATREVRLVLLRDTFHVPSEDTSLTLMRYVLRPSPIGYVINAPKRWVRSLRRSEGGAAPSEQPVLSELEQLALGKLAGLTRVSTNEESGLMSVTITTHDPYLSAAVVERSVDLLAERVRSIRTQKARDNLAFVSERFEQAEQDFRRQQARLAAFDDRNRAIQTASLRTQRERLTQDLSFKREYYNELRTEVTRAELELQRSEPIITVVEEPVVVLKSSGPKRGLIVMGALLLGLVLGVGIALLREIAGSSHEEDRAKWEEVRAGLVWPWRRRAPDNAA
ncbi:MAG: Wzz/FepE/Etk N-terminal domain-containing protein [Bacteroidota bacterium]